MPIYVYKCRDCKKVEDLMIAFKDKPETKPCECGGEMQEQFSVFSAEYKGTGFHRTDYSL